MATYNDCQSTNQASLITRLLLALTVRRIGVVRNATVQHVVLLTIVSIRVLLPATGYFSSFKDFGALTL
jgi:hypothetical protein